ncbi:nitronate monooxygenase [Streptomyces pseudovenezuelae]|uniref:nitronate monooxygenase n=1 Tax=Streptomyces pseudovenezuelae TaxID=67350 RepID=UPI0024756AAE|nr:nitronate monooxygenase [Streptomyces pseudovenezuelae]
MKHDELADRTGRGSLVGTTRRSACHRCSFGSLSVTSTEDRESVRLPRRRRPHALALPVIAVGGIATAANVTATLRAGAVAVMVGTVLLCTQESGSDRGSGRCCGLGRLAGRSQVGLVTRAWMNRRGATAGASIPPSVVGSLLPLA